MVYDQAEEYIRQKSDVIIAVAESYLSRGSAIQYDQLSMDRVLQITPRRNKFAPPEEATAQHTLFLDCSSFVHAVFYTAFGQELEADLTQHMIEQLPSIYSCHPTHCESEAGRLAIQDTLRSIIRPGDCIVMRFPQNGHVILCGKDGYYYHCTEKGSARSYDYRAKCNCFSSEGAIYREPLDNLFHPGTRYYLFDPQVLHFALLRPLDSMGSPTPGTLARLNSAAELNISVFSSHSGGRSAQPGDTVTYTVQIQNCTGRERQVEISFVPAPGFQPQDAHHSRQILGPFEVLSVAFPLTVSRSAQAYLSPPTVSVNGLPIWAERTLLHSAPPDGLDRAFRNQAETTNEETIPSTLSSVFRSSKAPSHSIVRHLFNTLFVRYDSVSGDVLWRRIQDPRHDGGLYGYFGGYGVVTPEIISDPSIRARHITAKDLYSGDLILCSDDAQFQKTYTCLATSSSLIGCFSPDTQPARISGADMEQFIDSLPGRFCYLVIRPSMVENLRGEVLI